MNKIHAKPGFTLVEIMITIAVIIILATLGIPGLLKSRTNANETLAKSALSSIGKAIEIYYVTNSDYPNAETDLLLPNANPPYLQTAYDGRTIRGYQYNYQLTGADYIVTATPSDCGTTGSKTFTLRSNNVISESGCT